MPTYPGQRLFRSIAIWHVAAWWQVSNPHPPSEIRLRLDAENRGTVAGMISCEQVPQIVHLLDPSRRKDRGMGFADALRCSQRSATLSVQHAVCRQAARLLTMMAAGIP